VKGGAVSVMTGLVPVTYAEPPNRRPRCPRERKSMPTAKGTTWVTGTSPVMTQTAVPLAPAWELRRQLKFDQDSTRPCENSAGVVNVRTGGLVGVVPALGPEIAIRVADMSHRRIWPPR
jgi:hypothetical protein